jgi:hypothetical protein
VGPGRWWASQPADAQAVSNEFAEQSQAVKAEGRTIEMNSFTPEYYRDIENRLERLLRILAETLPQHDTAMMNEFVDVGEYGLAFESICYVLRQAALKLPADVSTIIQALGEMMEVNEEQWMSLIAS